MFFAVAYQLVILVLWSAIDPYSSVVTVEDEIDLLAQHKCKSEATLVWLLLAIFPLLLMLGWGIFIVFDMWNMRR